MKDKTTYWLELSECVVSGGGCVGTLDNRETHIHWLFIEMCNGEFCCDWVFKDRDTVLSLLGSEEFRYLLSRFDDFGYLISTHVRDDEDN